MNRVPVSIRNTIHFFVGDWRNVPDIRQAAIVAAMTMPSDSGAPVVSNTTGERLGMLVRVWYAGFREIPPPLGMPQQLVFIPTLDIHDILKRIGLPFGAAELSPRLPHSPRELRAK